MITDSEKQRILNEIDMQLARSFSKWGNWNDLTYREMLKVILREYVEVAQAEDENDLHGEHGMFNELAQVAACSIKLMMQIMRRENANP